MAAAMIIVSTLLVLWLLYEFIHRLLPSWGTLLTNVIAAGAMMLDYLALLPWGTVMDAKQAALIAFAIAAANGIMRMRGAKASVGSGKP